MDMNVFLSVHIIVYCITRVRALSSNILGIDTIALGLLSLGQPGIILLLD